MSLFVDTSAFYATTDTGDQAHVRATELLVAGEEFVTTDHVLVESWSLICVRGSHDVAERFWSRVRGSAIRVETVLPGDLDAAWRIGEAFPHQDFSIVDRTSFAVMERLGIVSAVSFDDHFAIYRYGPRRERAFSVRR
ncbi:MAG TPA: PIN domain-containing protein [Solirubrobacteraceae bacterium]|nr:PIN domain-containing protein [Solirubrobacteraceae bacterium]